MPIHKNKQEGVNSCELGLPLPVTKMSLQAVVGPLLIGDSCRDFFMCGATRWPFASKTGGQQDD
jgi:hypothetical protein